MNYSIMTLNYVRQKAFYERKRGINPRREFEQFMIDASFNSLTTDKQKCFCKVLYKVKVKYFYIFKAMSKHTGRLL